MRSKMKTYLLYHFTHVINFVKFVDLTSIIPMMNPRQRNVHDYLSLDYWFFLKKKMKAPQIV